MVELKKDQKKALDKLLQDEPPVKELPPKENADDQVDSKKLQKRKINPARSWYFSNRVHGLCGQCGQGHRLNS